MALVYLVGFMGCGKSLCGRGVARSLAARFVDVDDEVVRVLSAPIDEIFRHAGEEVFRAEESRVLEWTTGLDHAVVATGGGSWCRERNRRAVRRAGGVSVFLDLPGEVLLRRLGSKGEGRPLFRSPDQALRLLERRRPDYLLADHRVGLTGDEEPDEVVRAVLALLPEPT